MTKTRILAAAAVLSMIASTQVFAQAAIGSPGTFSFYYPDRDVLNGGQPTQAAKSETTSARLRNFHGVMNSASDTSCAQRYQSYDSKSGMFLGHDGRRHPCN
jgi:BA14K-like protein